MGLSIESTSIPRTSLRFLPQFAENLQSFLYCFGNGGDRIAQISDDTELT